MAFTINDHCPTIVLRFLGRSKIEKNGILIAELFAVRRLWRHWCGARVAQVDREKLFFFVSGLGLI